MICPKCKSDNHDSARYCGICGAPLEEENRHYTVHNFDKMHAVNNGAYKSFGKIIGIALLMILPAIIAACVGGFVFKDDMAMSLGLAMVFCFAGLTAIIIWTISQEPYLNVAQMAVVQDNRTNAHYVIKFHGEQLVGWDTASIAIAAAHNAHVREAEAKKAQQDALCTKLVSEYQNGQHQPSALKSFFVSADFSIIELKEPMIKKKTNKETVYTYTDRAGKRKILLIPNAFPKLHICGR